MCQSVKKNFFYFFRKIFIFTMYIMIGLCLLDLALFSIGLTLAIIDINRYGFGLYMQLLAIIIFCFLIVVCFLNPKCLDKPKKLFGLISFLLYETNLQLHFYFPHAFHTQVLCPEMDEMKNVPFPVSCILYM